MSNYVEKVAFQSPPYTTSIELVEDLRVVIPDSLNYVIKDMFERVEKAADKMVEVKVELGGIKGLIRKLFERNNDK